MLHPRKKRTLITWAGLHLLEGIAFALALVALGVAILIWRLSFGPMNLEPFRPAIRALTSWSLGAARTEVKAVQLSWARETQTLDIKLDQLKVFDKRSRPILSSRHLTAGLSLPALTHLRFAMGRFAAEDAQAILSLSPQGRLALGYEAAGEPRRFNPELVTDVVLGLIGPEDRARPLSYLRSATLTDGQISFYARATPVEWQADIPELSLSRRDTGVRLIGHGRIIAPGLEPAELSADVTTQPGHPNATLHLDWSNLRLHALVPPLGVGRMLSRIDAPMDGDVDLENKGLEALSAAHMDIKLGKGILRLNEGNQSLDGAHFISSLEPASGTLVFEGQASGPRLALSATGRLRPVFANKGGLKRIDFRANSAGTASLGLFDPQGAPAHLSAWSALGAYDVASRTLDFSSLVLRLKAGVLAGQGQWVRGVDSGAARFAGRLRGALDARDIFQFWPHGRFPGTRDWLDRGIRGGRVRDAAVMVNLPPRVFAEHKVRDEDIQVTFQVDGAEVLILKGVAPLSQGSGFGVLKGKSLEITLNRGRWGQGIVLSKGRLMIPRFGDPKEFLKVAVHADGPVAELMRLLNGGVLRLADRANLKPDLMSGQAAVDFALNRPLRSDVQFKDLTFTYDARIRDAIMRKAVMDFSASSANLRLAGNQQGMTISGPGLYGPLRGMMTMAVQFTASESKRDLVIDGRVDGDSFKSAGLPFEAVIRGVSPARVHVAHRGSRMVDGTMTMDLGPAAIELPGGVWRKAAGAAGTLTANFLNAADGGVLFKSVSANAPGLNISGSAQFARDGRLLRLSVPSFAINNYANLSVQAGRSGDGRQLVVNATGDFLDARHLIAWALRPRTGTGRTGFPLSIRADIDAVRVADDREVRQVRYSSEQDTALRRLSLAALDKKDQPWMLEIAPDENGQRNIVAKTPDAGLAVKILTGLHQVSGGTAEAKGTWSADNVMKLDIHAKSIRVRDVPALATLLSVASIGGLANALGGEGLQFTDVRLPLTLNGPKAKVGEARATGPGLGVTTTGEVNTQAKTLALSGTLAPAYGVNAVLGNIPLLGDVLVSRKGEGIVGFTYTLEGPIAKPRAFVNPLSALAPGVFRRIFEGGAGRAPDASETLPKEETVKGGNPNKR